MFASERKLDDEHSNDSGAFRDNRVNPKSPSLQVNVPLDVTVLRSGITDNIPGRTLEIGEGGMGVVVASQLLLDLFALSFYSRI